MPSIPLNFSKAIEGLLNAAGPISRTEYTGHITQIFVENMMRVIALGDMPFGIAGYSFLTGWCDAAAYLEIGLPLDSLKCMPGHPEFDEETFKIKETKRTELISNWMKSQPVPGFSIRSIGENRLPNIVHPKLGPNAGLVAVLEGMILAAWTAFESMATDLWVMAVNYGPATWSKRVVEKISKSGGIKDDSERSSKDQERSIPLSRLIGEYRYDIAHKLGTLLKKEGKIDFQTFPNIRLAYEALFGEKAKILFSQPENESIEAVEQCRHVLAHRLGRVDETFKRKAAKFAKLSDDSEGYKMLLTGDIVNQMLIVVNSAAKALIELVDDEFIQEHEKHWWPDI